MSVRFSRWLVSILLRRIETGSLIVIEGDERRVYGSGPPAATVEIESPRTWPKLLRASPEFRTSTSIQTEFVLTWLPWC